MSPVVLLAAGPDATADLGWVWGAIAVFVVLALASLAIFVVSRYRRCPSNRVLVIYGKVAGGNTAQCIHGGASFVWPLIQDHQYLDLEPDRKSTRLNSS